MVKKAVKKEVEKTTPTTKKSCSFCASSGKPLYTDVAALNRFVSSRGKIVPKMRSGVCSKHQRALAREIKRARHLALLPFSVKI